MTAQQMSVVLGTEVEIRCEDLTVTCKVLDMKQAYGKVRYQIEPIRGTGTQWVEAARIVVAKNAA